MSFKNLRKGIQSTWKKIKTVEATDENINDTLHEFELILLSNDVAYEAAEEITKKIKEKIKGTRVSRLKNMQKLLEIPFKEAVEELLIPKYEIDIIENLKQRKEEKSKPLVILMLGINGTGKTTTCAKIANLAIKENFRVVMAAADTFRTGAQEQIKVHADRLKIKVISGQYGSDSASVAYDAIMHAKARRVPLVLIDTAGRMATNLDLMGEMEKIKRVCEPDLVLLTVDALAGNDAVNQARDFNEKIGIDGSILNKMDADAKGGAALSISFATGGKPICYVGVGQEYKDLKKFDSQEILKNIF